MWTTEPNGVVWEGLLGAVIGAFVAGGLSALILSVQLRSEAKRREAERAQELKSLATALYCEVTWFYMSAMFFSIQAQISKVAEKLPITFIRPPLNFVTFTVFESNADKIGLFETSTVAKLIEFVYDAKLYLALAQEHKRRLNERANKNIPYYDEKAIEATLERTTDSLGEKINPLSEALNALAQIE